jgi:hypothetical protein
MTPATITSSTRATTAYPPLPTQPCMKDWLARQRVPFWKRIFGGPHAR